MPIGLFIYGALNLFMVVRPSKMQFLFDLYGRPNRLHYGSCPSLHLSFKDIIDVLQQCYRRLTRLSSVVLCNECIVAKRCKMGPRLLLITNRKLNIQMTLKSLTLDDLEGL